MYIKKLGRTAALIIAVTAASKLAGFLREAFTAAEFGATAYTDAYVIAVTITSAVSVMSFEVVNNAFLPLYVGLDAKQPEKSGRFASNLLNIFILITLAVVILGQLLAGPLVKLYAPGFGSEIHRLAVILTRISLPVMVFTGVSIISGAILYSRECFFPQAAMGIPNHILVIAFLAFTGSRFGVKGLAIAAAAGTASQLLVQLPFLKKNGFRYRPVLDFKMSETVAFFKTLVPVFIGSSARQINILVDRVLASGQGRGSVSILNYANVIYISIAGMFILTLTKILYPKIAKAPADERKAVVQEGIRSLLLVIVPVTAVICSLSSEITGLLFQRGEFTLRDAQTSSQVLLLYSLGLIPAAMADILTKTFYSRASVKKPMQIGLISVGLNIILNLLLINIMGIKGLALSTSISAAVSLLLLSRYIREEVRIFNRKLMKNIIYTMAAGILTFIVSYAVKQVMYIYLDEDKLNMLIVSAVSSAAGLSAYFALTYGAFRKLLIK